MTSPSLSLGAKKPPSKTVAEILTRGRPPFVEVDFPRYDHEGKPIARVHMRLLNLAEEQTALAQARVNCSNLTKQASDYKSDMNDLEHNERMIEILGSACRNIDDPSMPFFEGGASEVRLFTSDEIGVLASQYAALKERNPHVEHMGELEFESLLAMFAKDLDSFPFSLVPRGLLETFTESCVRRLVKESSTNTTATNGPSP